MCINSTSCPLFLQYDNENTRSTRNTRNTATGGPPGMEQRGDKPRNPSPGTLASSKASSTAVDQQPYETSHKSPHDYLREAGSAEKVRDRNAKSLLMDMFGM